MRSLVLLLGVLLVPATAWSDEAGDIRDRALKAAAKDPTNLKKLHMHTLKARGVSVIAAEPVAAAFELAAIWPGHLRATWEFGAGVNKSSVTVSAADDRGWRQTGTMKPIDLSIEELNDIRADAYAYFVSTLVTLNDVESRLSAVGPGKVDDHPVIGLKVARRPWPEVTLYFDSTSHLLRKMSYKSREAGVTLVKEMHYDNHKESNGLQLPTKQVTYVQGKEVYTWTNMEFAFPDKIDPKFFAKP